MRCPLLYLATGRWLKQDPPPMNGGCRTRKKLQRTRVIHIRPRFVWASFVSRIALGETEDSPKSLGFRKKKRDPSRHLRLREPSLRGWKEVPILPDSLSISPYLHSFKESRAAKCKVVNERLRGIAVSFTFMPRPPPARCTASRRLSSLFRPRVVRVVAAANEPI